MGIDLKLSAQLPRRGLIPQSSKSFLTDVEQVIREAAGEQFLGGQTDQDGGESLLFLRFHPAAEDVRIAVAKGQITLTARTNAAGPGYHQFVVSLCDALAARLNVRWSGDDQTDYFQTRDRPRLERRMLDWFATLCRTLLEPNLADVGPLAIALPLGFRHAETAFALTPSGPRTREWIQAVAEDPAKGREFFPWWSHPCTAADQAREAIAYMWTDCRWALPRTDDEIYTLDRILDLLASAHSRDPSLELPWREWAELLALVRPDDFVLPGVTARAAKAPDARPIGYRRTDQLPVTLPGDWTINIPGSFSDEMDPESTWIAWDETRTIRITSMGGPASALPSPLPSMIADLPPGAEPISRPLEHGHAAGFIARESTDGHEFQTLSGEVVRHDGHSVDVGLISISFDDPADRDWALRVWESFTPPPLHPTEDPDAN